MLSPQTGSNHTPPGFVDAIVTAVDLELITLQDVKNELENLWTQMNENNGTQTIASTINGKYFGFQVTMTVEEKFAAFAEAVRKLNGTATVCTYADFRCLQR